jgi:hydrogenase maturation protease
MTDDGAGVHVAEALRGRGLGDHVRVLDGGTLSFTLLDEVEEAAFLVVADAAQLNAEPGTVRLFRDREMDVYLSAANRPSVHEVNLMDVLTAARIRGRMPNRYALVGIQPESIGWGTEPSATVAAAVDEAVTIIERMIKEMSEAAVLAEEMTA